MAITRNTLPQAGARVGVVTGPGQFPRDNPGTVLCQITTRWGTHALVLMDDGETKQCTGLTTTGIGFYLLPKR